MSFTELMYLTFFVRYMPAVRFFGLKRRQSTHTRYAYV